MCDDCYDGYYGCSDEAEEKEAPLMFNDQTIAQLRSLVSWVDDLENVREAVESGEEVDDSMLSEYDAIYEEKSIEVALQDIFNLVKAELAKEVDEDRL